MAEPAILISAGALLLSVIVAVLGYFGKRPLVPAWTVTEIRKENEELRDRCESMEREVLALKQQVNILMGEREFWLGEYRKLKAAG